MTQVPFIGRERELAQINKLIQPLGTQTILCIQGEGGVGKTRLIQEVYRQIISQNSHNIFTHIIDFDNHAFHLGQTLGLQFAKLMGEENFTSYIEGLSDLRKMELAELSQHRIAQETLAVNRAFANCFNEVSAEKKVVYFFDTTDALAGKTDVWGYLADIFANAKNYLLVITGRDAQSVGDFLKSKLGETVRIADLSPLGTEASERYLQEKQAQLHITLEPTLAQKLLFLAQGRPILIDLVVEWQARNIPLDWLIQSDLAELQSLSARAKKQRQKEFEFNLVRHIADIRHPIDRLTLLMSRIYPLDKELLNKLFKNWPSILVKQRFVEAKSYTFVKILPDGSITLHDEMRRLVNEYVMDLVDPQGDRQVRNSQIAMAHLQIKVNDLMEELQNRRKELSDIERTELETRLDLLTKQLIKHALVFRVDKGFNIYCRAVEKAQREKRYKFAEQLEEIIRPYKFIFNKEQLFKYRTLHGKQLNNLGKPEEAIALFDQLLQDNQGKAQREAEIHNILAVSEVQRGNLTVALKHQLRCLEILEELNVTQYIPTVSNYVGYIYRLSGRWQKAIEYYQKAFNVALDTKARSGTIASIMNNLGYLFGMDGRYLEAIGYCEKAIDLWQSMNNELFIGQGESTLGTIYGNKGEYNKAVHYLNKAITRFKRGEAIERLVSAYTELGAVYFIKGTETKESEQLDLARKYLDQSYTLALRDQLLKQVPKILLHSSYTYWELGQKSRARRNNEQAYEMGKEFYDLHTVVNSLVAMAEFDYDEGDFEKISSYAEILDEVLVEEYGTVDYKFPLLTGRMSRLQAEVAFKNQQWDKAFDYYKNGLAMIAQHGGYGKYAIQHELENVKQNLLSMPTDMAEAWITQFKEYWRGLEPVDKYTPMLSWCDQLIVDIKLRALA